MAFNLLAMASNLIEMERSTAKKARKETKTKETKPQGPKPVPNSSRNRTAVGATGPSLPQPPTGLLGHGTESSLRHLDAPESAACGGVRVGG